MAVTAAALYVDSRRVCVFVIKQHFRPKLSRNGPKLPRNTPKWALRAPVHTFDFVCFLLSAPSSCFFIRFIFFEGTYNTMGMFLMVFGCLVATDTGWNTTARYLILQFLSRAGMILLIPCVLFRTCLLSAVETHFVVAFFFTTGRIRGK